MPGPDPFQAFFPQVQLNTEKGDKIPRVFHIPAQMAVDIRHCLGKGPGHGGALPEQGPGSGHEKGRGHPMPGHIPQDDADQVFFIVLRQKIIIIIPAGFIAINDFSCNIQPRKRGILFGQKILLDLPGQVKGFLHHFPFLKAPCHFVHYIPGKADFISGHHPDALVKLPLPDVHEHQGQFVDGIHNVFAEQPG